LARAGVVAKSVRRTRGRGRSRMTGVWGASVMDVTGGKVKRCITHLRVCLGLYTLIFVGLGGLLDQQIPWATISALYVIPDT
jgi:hypothetical protein